MNKLVCIDIFDYINALGVSLSQIERQSKYNQSAHILGLMNEPSGETGLALLFPSATLFSVITIYHFSPGYFVIQVSVLVPFLSVWLSPSYIFLCFPITPVLPLLLPLI